MVSNLFKFKWLNNLSPVQLILFFYCVAVFVSTCILAMPIAHEDGVDLSLMDTLFIAVSAISVTGLTPTSISETFNTFGYFLLAFIMQFGAVGIMAIGTSIWVFLGKKIGLRERRLIMTDQNQTSFAGMVRLIQQIMYVILTIELIGFIILGTYYLQYFPTVGEAYLNGFFSSVSATTNGGFDITGDSLFMFRNDYFVQFITMLLIIFGAIGFPVLIEVKEYMFARAEVRKSLRFSLFTKVTSLTFFALVVVGAIFIAIFDAGNFFADKSWHEILFYSLFQSVTTRSAGLSTMDVSQLSEQNHLFISLLMFIGASPSSAGGGIRTTTFALVLIFIITYARGGASIRLFGREVYQDDLLKAVTVSLMAIALVFGSVLVISIFEPYSMASILFEVTSAFGTVGLSLGITSELTTPSKIILMLLMFIGRVGIITALFMFKNNKSSGKFHYPKEKIIIG